MKKLLIALLLVGSAQAAPASYLVVCTSNCVAPDGTAQPDGTIQNNVIWDSVAQPSWSPGTGLVLHPDNGQQVGTVYSGP